MIIVVFVVLLIVLCSIFCKNDGNKTQKNTNSVSYHTKWEKYKPVYISSHQRKEICDIISTYELRANNHTRYRMNFINAIGDVADVPQMMKLNKKYHTSNYDKFYLEYIDYESNGTFIVVVEPTEWDIWYPTDQLYYEKKLEYKDFESLKIGDSISEVEKIERLDDANNNLSMIKELNLKDDVDAEQAGLSSWHFTKDGLVIVYYDISKKIRKIEKEKNQLCGFIADRFDVENDIDKKQYQYHEQKSKVDVEGIGSCCFVTEYPKKEKSGKKIIKPYLTMYLTDNNGRIIQRFPTGKPGNDMKEFLFTDINKDGKQDLLVKYKNGTMISYLQRANHQYEEDEYASYILNFVSLKSVKEWDKTYDEWLYTMEKLKPEKEVVDDAEEEVVGADEEEVIGDDYAYHDYELDYDNDIDDDIEEDM